ncbi:diguanylate cyclase [Brevibacillus panacihumi W25]|uniref:Diguanylate cyclase n=1 Tax=Brevibacillus panacihumi W25 TaxID=1408254 RepID=V6MFT1_9BACL|nr:sensor domain-containing diguanylate cyclase [Brevibacillus panacihumi]EST54258.1 diguanylate cyclase [Brevibacillus panacihumi W25]
MRNQSSEDHTWREKQQDSAKHDIATLLHQYGDVLSDLFEHISDMLFMMSVEELSNGEYQFRYELMNPSAMRISELDESAYGKRFEDVFPAEKADQLNRMYTEAVTCRKATRFTSEDEIIGETILTPVINKEGICTHVFAVTRDITQHKKRELTLEFMAYHDMLTGLPNRRLLELDLQRALEDANSTQEMVAILFLDCDYFKQINDTWGHQAGDVFLQLLAERLKSCVREEDTLSRLGGDEFVIVLRRVSRPDQAAEVAARILHSIQQPWQVHDATFTVTTSIGISLYPLHSLHADELLNCADEALYRAKAKGRNQYVIYSRESETDSR